MEDEFPGEPEDDEGDEGPEAFNGQLPGGISLSHGSGRGVSTASVARAKSNPAFQSGFEGLNLFQQLRTGLEQADPDNVPSLAGPLPGILDGNVRYPPAAHVDAGGDHTRLAAWPRRVYWLARSNVHHGLAPNLFRHLDAARELGPLLLLGE